MRKLIKSILLLFVVSTLSTTLLAQAFDVSWGDKAKLMLCLLAVVKL
jgi:hypothetical protein